MKRKIINIKKDLCVGCGNCVTGCHQGALEIIDGKARLVKEDFCDGLGVCIGTCPTGALSIEEKEFTPEIKKSACGCPGSAMIDRREEKKVATPSSTSSNISISDLIGHAIPSELQQWPVQLHLVNPEAPYFKDTEIVVISTCSPVACADIHWRFIRGRAVVVACPKLDRTENYSQKLADIFDTANTKKVLSVIMAVPCCKGLTELIKEAVNLSKNKEIKVEEHIVQLNGGL